MPKKVFYLDKEKTEAIKLSWGFYFKNLTITKDEQPIGQVSNAKELKEGRAFTLPDGKTLSVQLKRTGLGRELEILINGKPVPGEAQQIHFF